MDLGHGWLAKDPQAPATLAGVSFDATLPTRREEYGLVYDAVATLPAARCVDLAAGYVPGWHVAPEILAALGWKVDAVDIDPRSAEMKHCNGVRRIVADMTATGLLDGRYPLVLSISVLEHVNDEERRRVAAEAARLAAPGALLVATADEVPPETLASWFTSRFDTGSLRPDPDEHLSPRVSYVVARRRDDA